MYIDQQLFGSLNPCIIRLDSSYNNIGTFTYIDWDLTLAITTCLLSCLARKYRENGIRTGSTPENKFIYTV